jgi:subtilase family serine protease
VSDIENTFHVALHQFHHPTEARDFYAPDREPTVKASVPLLQIYGLNNFDRPRCFAHIQPTSGASGSAGGGSVAGGYFRGKDFRNAYVPGVTLDGSGQSVGLVEFDGYYTSDITTYESQAGLPNVPLQNVLINTGSFSPSNNTNAVGEVSLDIEMVISMATNLSKLYVFESPIESSANWATMLNSMASSNQIKQFSSSWGFSPPLTSSDQYFQTMIAQGQTFFDAVGDGGAFISPVPWPGDSPYVISVGGTTLTMSGSGTAYVSETVWNSGFLGTNNAWYGNGSSGYWASGGGVSTSYSIPSWQLGVTGLGSTSKRNVPDVALTANEIWVNYFNGKSGYFIGTSCAAPLWAGFTALVNQQCALDGRPAVGFINPALYAIGKNGGVSFHDITTGNNAWSTNNFYYAVGGYDLCTGWGTPGAAMISALENFAGAVWVDFSVAGPGTGTYDDPYNTLALGINYVTVNGTVAVKGPNHSLVTPTITKPLILNASGGLVTIGK